MHFGGENAKARPVLSCKFAIVASKKRIRLCFVFARFPDFRFSLDFRTIFQNSVRNRGWRKAGGPTAYRKTKQKPLAPKVTARGCAYKNIEF